MSTAGFDFKRGGKLIYNTWVKPEEWDDETEEYKVPGYYKSIDMTEGIDWIYKRSYNVLIEPSFTLNDLFMFLSEQVESSPAIIQLLFPNCYIAEYVEQWKKVDQTSIKSPVYGDDNIEYLELYWNPEISFNWDYNKDEVIPGTRIHGIDDSGVHGAGFKLKEDKWEEYCKDKPVWVKGQRIHWGIDFVPFEELLGLPIVLNEEYVILEDWETHKAKNGGDDYVHTPITKLVETTKNYSLEEVIRSITYELSFYGTEDEKLEKSKELNETLDEVKKQHDCDD